MCVSERERERESERGGLWWEVLEKVSTKEMKLLFSAVGYARDLEMVV